MEFLDLNILIIEDEPDFVMEIKRHVSLKCREPIYTVASSVDIATYYLTNSFFDLIFLDLKLPSVDEAMDSHPQHGRDLLDVAREVAPGTPIFMLTGSSAEQFLPEMMALSHKVDIWGQGEALPLIGFQAKHRVNKLLTGIKPYIEAYEAANDVEIDSAIQLDLRVLLLIRIFTNSVGGVFSEVFQIGGGLSDALVLSIIVKDGSGAKIHNSIAKIGPHNYIHDEVYRHDKYVSRLDPGATPRKVAVFNHGAKDRSGVFYSLVSDSNANGFVSVEKDAKQIVNGIRERLQRWTCAATQRRVSIKSIRQDFISDEQFLSIRHLIQHDWVERFEEYPIQANWGCVHGDMHGLNILLSDDLLPVLIDYGDVGESPLSKDPVTFELSTFFHPNGPLKDSVWPDQNDALVWGKNEFSGGNCPAVEFFDSCREWSEGVAAGKRERAAVAYSYLVRQLKYPNCDVVRVNSLLAGAKNLFDST